MPFLDICDETGNLYDWAGCRLLAILIYPDESKQNERDLIFTNLIAEALEGAGSKVPERDGAAIALDECLLTAYRAIMRTGLGREFLNKQASLHGAGGLLAGIIFRFMLRSAIYAPEHFSRNKAYYAVNEIQSRWTKASGVHQIGTAVSKLKGYWKAHRSDLHLQAAALALIAEGSDYLGPEDIIPFLVLAETYRDLGEAWEILDPSQLWRPPPKLKLFESQIPAELVLPPLDSEEIDILKTYRAE